MNNEKKLNKIDDVLELKFDDESIFNDLSYNYELNFKDGNLISDLAHDLHHLCSHILPNGIKTYLDHMEEEVNIDQALNTLKTINSPNYDILKTAMTKVVIDENGLIITDNYNDLEDWDQWSLEDTNLLFHWIKKNKNNFLGESNLNNSNELDAAWERVYTFSGFYKEDRGSFLDPNNLFHSYYSAYKPEFEVTYEEFYRKLKMEKEFRKRLYYVVLNADYNFIDFETPPINSKNLNEPFEFVIYSGIDREEADLKPFEDLFNTSNKNVIVHHNLKENSTYIIPNKIHKHKNVYMNWNSFMKRAPDEQIDELLKTLGNVVLESINDDNIWVSVSTTSIGYFYFRIDRKPIYYNHKAYKI
jgi:hypothetical protein